MRRMLIVAGALLTAGLSSACCWIPLLLGGAGAGALGLGATLEPFRPYLIGLTLILLGVAFYLAYRPERAHGDCCTVPTAPSRRLQRGLLWLVTLFALLSLLNPYLHARHAKQGAIPASTSVPLQTTLFSVDRIYCHACTSLINKHLRKMPGVHLVDVDIAKRQVLVHYDARLVQPTQLRDAIEQAGFPAKTIKASPLDAEHGCCKLGGETSR